MVWLEPGEPGELRREYLLDLKNTTLRVVELDEPGSISPTDYLRWLILYGNIAHLTGEITTIKIERKDEKTLGIVKTVAAATSSGDVSLSIDEEYILDDSMQITLEYPGMPPSSLKVVVLEWKPGVERIDTRKGFWRFL